ncbi:MAG: DNA-processing protein DprA [bacterium]
MDDLVYLFALSKIARIGQATVRALLHKFESYPAIFTAPAEELLKIKRITPATAAEIMKSNQHLEELALELDEIQHNQIQVIPIDSNRYPKLLKNIPDAPMLIYLMGSIIPEDERSIAIVGSRSASELGQEIAHNLARALVQQGITIISGLAIGIDTAGHQGALSADGRTIACLGSGFSRIYPPENQELAQQIPQSGAIISELPPKTTVESKFLLMRDRIIAGLSKAVIVIESEEDGGAIYTARKANKYDRQVLYINWHKFPGVLEEAQSKYIQNYLKETGLPINNIDSATVSYLVAIAKNNIDLPELPFDH